MKSETLLKHEHGRGNRQWSGEGKGPVFKVTSILFSLGTGKTKRPHLELGGSHRQTITRRVSRLERGIGVKKD